MEDGSEPIISRLISPFELIRNCDLPPPQKLFPGIDEPAIAAPLGDEKRRLRSRVGGDAAAGGGWGGELELLRALRLSQTRAREAAAERDAATNALIGEAARASAYLRWVAVLELEVAALKSGSCPPRHGRRRERLCGSEEEEEERRDSMAWMVAFAIPLGIAGIVVLACKYFIERDV